MGVNCPDCGIDRLGTMSPEDFILYRVNVYCPDCWKKGSQDR
jgi:hypothetical protein